MRSVLNNERPQIVTAILIKKKRTGGTTIPELKLYYTVLI